MTNDNPIKLPTYIEVPAIKKDAMAGNGPFKASKDIQQSLGFPGEKVDNWQQVAIDKIAETKSKYRSVQVFLDASKTFAGLNAGILCAGILIVVFFEMFLPVFSALFLTIKLPNPLK